MNKHPDFEIHQALRTYPGEAAPPALISKTMERIGGTSQLSFRLSWFDYVISSGTAGTASACLYLWQQLSAYPLAALQLDLLQLGHSLRLLVFVALMGLGHH